MKKRKIGKFLLYTSALTAAFGGFIADFNRTHLFNPNWPPHAKYHDAMSISLGFFLGCVSLYFLKKKKNLFFAALLPFLFYTSMCVSFVFPNTGGMEVEFPELVPQIGGFFLNELPFAVGFMAVTVIGYILATNDGQKIR